MLWCVGMLVCLSMWLASGPASAVSLTWSISGGTFADGGTFSGTFVQDPAQPRPSTWDVNVVGGGSSFPAHSYTPANSSVLLLQWVPNAEPTYHFIDLADNRQLRLTPASPLDGSAATVPLSLLNNSGRVECFNCAPFRYITGGSLVLESATPTLILESIAPDPTVVGATTTATISIDAIAALGPPTGSITIYDTSGDAICSFPLPTTSCSFAPTAPGGLTLFARYTGDANYQSATSNELSFTTLPAAVTMVTLAPVVPNRTAIGGATTATVTVATVVGYPPPTGLITVFFYGSGDTTLCTITLPATTCTFAPKAGGNQTVAAQYSGDASYASGYSNQQPITVAPVPPVVTLVSLAPNPTAVGTATTATVTVGTVPPFGPPTGTIEVFDGIGGSLCTITLPATSCAFTPTTPGTQTVIARYDGDANYDNGLSNALVLIVRAPLTIAKAFVPPGILVNGTTTLTFTLTNPNAGTALTGVGFTDAFPAGLAVAATPNATTTGCGSPTFAPAAGNSGGLFGRHHRRERHLHGDRGRRGYDRWTQEQHHERRHLDRRRDGRDGRGVPRSRHSASGGTADDRQGVRGPEHRRQRDYAADVHSDQSQSGERTERGGLYRRAARRAYGGQRYRLNVRGDADHERRQPDRARGSHNCGEWNLHVFGDGDGHDWRRQEQHHERRHFDRGRHGRDRLGQPRGGSAADDHQVLRGGEHRREQDHDLDLLADQPEPGD